MKRFLHAGIAVWALAGFIGSAAAADLSNRMPVYKAQPYAAPVFNWTGAYIGLNGGGGWGKSNYAGLDKYDVSGGLIGATIGYNWQFGTWVFGLEGDIDWTGIRGSGTNLYGATTKNDFLATMRGRVGYSFDRFMPYVTGGLAIGNINANDYWFSKSQTNAGWTVGAGVEFAFAPQWTAKVEYLYVDLGSVDLVGVNTDFYTNIVRGGVNLKF
jgi:outer membrane immunogenic protein